jgi:hypothetical protein
VVDGIEEMSLVVDIVTTSLKYTSLNYKFK